MNFKVFSALGTAVIALVVLLVGLGWLEPPFDVSPLWRLLLVFVSIIAGSVAALCAIHYRGFAKSTLEAAPIPPGSQLP